MVARRSQAGIRGSRDLAKMESDNVFDRVLKDVASISWMRRQPDKAVVGSAHRIKVLDR
jgi:hypothetical protein